MIYTKDDKYFRTCDDCGEIVEIQKQTYLKNNKKTQHFCRSCSQKGDRNHRFGVEPWNTGLTKKTDERVKLYGEKGGVTKQGSVPWNKNQTYDELKGEEWSDNFKNKISAQKKESLTLNVGIQPEEIKVILI